MKSFSDKAHPARTVVSFGPPPREAFLGMVRLLLQASLGRLMLWQQRASERAALARLNDHELRDVGLTRMDVEAEAAKSFWRP